MIQITLFITILIVSLGIIRYSLTVGDWLISVTRRNNYIKYDFN